MFPRLTPFILALGVVAVSTTVVAKLPAANPSPEEKAKAAEATAKTAWSNKVADFQLCKAMERSAANHFEVAKQKGASGAAADPSAPACVDPGPFVYTPPEAKPADPAAPKK